MITLPLRRQVALVDLLFMVVTVPWEAWLTMVEPDQLNRPKPPKLLEEAALLVVLMMHSVADHTKARLNSTTAPSRAINKAAVMT
jgi:hypothetical protein